MNFIDVFEIVQGNDVLFRRVLSTEYSPRLLHSSGLIFPSAGSERGDVLQAKTQLHGRKVVQVQQVHACTDRALWA